MLSYGRLKNFLFQRAGNGCFKTDEITLEEDKDNERARESACRDKEYKPF
jgi:hypothetical protein